MHIIVSRYFWCRLSASIHHILLLRTIPEYDHMLLFKNLNHFLRLGLLLFLSLEWLFSLTPISASTFHSQNTETRILFPYALFWISIFAPHVLVVLFKLPTIMLVPIILLFIEFWGRRCSKTVWIDLWIMSQHIAFLFSPVTSNLTISSVIIPSLVEWQDVQNQLLSFLTFARG